MKSHVVFKEILIDNPTNSSELLKWQCEWTDFSAIFDKAVVFREGSVKILEHDEGCRSWL